MLINIKTNRIYLLTIISFMFITTTAQRVSKVKNINAICDSILFNYTPKSIVQNVTFLWKRDSINGIQNSASSGNGTINEVLINTTGNPITVIYEVFLTPESGCTHIDTIKLIVLSSARTNNITQNINICDSSKIFFTPTSITKSSSYLWNRNIVQGISNIAKKGTTAINEVLINTTTDIISVPYFFLRTTTSGCQASDTLNVNVIPRPFGILEINPTNIYWGDQIKFNLNSTDTIVYNYNWNFGDGSQLNTNENPINHFIYSGSIGVKTTSLYVTNSYGCVKTFNKKITLLGDTTIVTPAPFAFKKNYSLAAYPIPFTTSLYLKYNSDEIQTARYIVNDLAGRIIYNEEIVIYKGSNTATLPSSKLLTGMVYVIKIKSNSIDYEEKVFKK